MQLQFNLPEIDRDKTKAAVEKALAPAASNLPSSSTEQAAIANVEYDQQRVRYID